MFKLLKLVFLLRKVDRMAFKERAKIKLKFCGKPSCVTVTSESGQVVGEWYSVPIFYQSLQPYNPVRIAIHEVRHRVQHNYPKIRLFTIGDEDLPDDFQAWFQTHLQLEAIKKLLPEEIDAQIFDELSYPIFSANDTDGFLKLLFHGT